MKRSILLAISLFMALSAVAQGFYQSHYQSATEPQTLLPNRPLDQSRKEIILPTVNGYIPYKADLHMHSTYSDGVMKYTGRGRIHEAWRDGLDVIAVTDHMSVKVYEDKAGVPTPEKDKVKRGKRPAQAVKDAVSLAGNYGILAIPGVEITGNAKTLGHFNALFTTNNLEIFDYDPMQAIRNARKQGALIMQNHPGWRQSTLEQTQFVNDVYAEKLVDGIELMNGYYFYPRALQTAKENKLFIASTTDIHGTTAETYRENQHLRNMTIIFAKELTSESIREGLEKHRTLAYSFGVLGGEESLLRDFFQASIETRKIAVVLNKSKKKTQRVMLTNKTSLPYTLRFGKGNPVTLPALSSIIVSTKPGKPVQCTVLNMWYGMNQHPVMKLKY